MEVAPGLEIADDELTVQYSRSSGPGGQNVNKVASRAQLRWTVAHTQSLPEPVRDRFLRRYASRLTSAGELVLTGQRHRDARRNLADCYQRLADMVQAVRTPPTKRKPTRPTKGSKERRLTQKKQRSQRKKQRQRPSFDD